MAPSLLSKTLQAAGVTAFATTAAFFVWTKHAHFTPAASFDANSTPPTPRDEPLFAPSSPWLRRFNPHHNPATADECVRRLPLTKIRGDLIEDSLKGGTGLVEAFCQGVWGGFGYTIQRLYLERKYRNDTTTSHQLWTPTQLRNSTYEPGTEITDHFVVLAKTPNSILIRCGDSPLHNPDGPRASDGLFEMTATADLERGFAEFRLKSVFFVGDQKVEREAMPQGPMTGWMLQAHKLYTKLWMESAMSNVRR